MGAAEQLIDRIRHWCRGLFAPRAVERQMDEELRSWTTELAARHEARGADPAEALRRAAAELGNVEALKDEVRDRRPGASWRGLAPDVRDGWRTLRRAPGITAAMIATFAIGIGATTAIFSVVSAMLVAPLPYRDPSRLAIIWSDMTEAGYPRAPLSGPELADLRARTTAFDGFGAIWATTGTLTGTGGEPEQLRTGLVTTNFFDVLGAAPALGRTFGEEDERQTPTSGVVLAWPLFARRYGADPSLVGRTIDLNGRSLVVLGVMPADFRLLFPADASVPDDLQAFTCLRAQNLPRSPRGQQYLRVIGRMKPGVTLATAAGDVTRVATALSHEYSEYGSAGRRFTTAGLHDDDVREMRPALLMLAAGVAVLLLIACVNVAGLMLARAAGRVQETSVRIAIGAGRSRLFRLYLSEGLIVALLGGVCGVAVGWLGLHGLLHWRPIELARIDRAGLDVRVLGVAAIVTLSWGLLLSLAPLSESLRVNVFGALHRADQRSGSRASLRLRFQLVGAQIALSLTLLVAAGLLVRTFLNIEARDLGFRADRIATFRLSVPFQRYPSAAAVGEFSRSLLDRLRALPGVTGAGAISHLPFDNLPNWGGGFAADQTKAAESPVADYRAVTPGFFEAAGVRLQAGRFFTESDAAGAPLVVVIDDELAGRLWPGRSPVGERLLVDPQSNGTPSSWAEVIGVVSHLRLRSLVEPMAEQVYFSARQVLRNPLAYVVATDGSRDVAPAVRQTVAGLDPALPVFDPRDLASYVADARAGRRFMAIITICFAAVALLLASIGLFGVIAYMVAERRREFGVRLALGAAPRNVAGLVMRQGATIGAFGIAGGLALALPAALAFRTQLVDVAPFDPATIALSIGGVALVTLAACWIPIRRATSVSPSRALRQD